MKTLSRMKNWTKKKKIIPFLEAQLRCWWLALHLRGVQQDRDVFLELGGCALRKSSSGRGGFSRSRSGFQHCSLASSPLSISQPAVGEQPYPAKIHDQERLSPTAFLLSTNTSKPSPELGSRCLPLYTPGWDTCGQREIPGEVEALSWDGGL